MRLVSRRIIPSVTQIAILSFTINSLVAAPAAGQLGSSAAPTLSQILNDSSLAIPAPRITKPRDKPLCRLRHSTPRIRLRLLTWPTPRKCWAIIQTPEAAFKTLIAMNRSTRQPTTTSRDLPENGAPR